jgi:hypothetical protein
MSARLRDAKFLDVVQSGSPEHVAEIFSGWGKRKV